MLAVAYDCWHRKRQAKSLHKKQQVFVANGAAEILENSSMDQWRYFKGVENSADIGTRGIVVGSLKESVWINRPAWLQADEENWPKPWCQVNELEPEKFTSTVATETKQDQLFDWRRYSTFNRIRNFIAYCKRFKTRQKCTLKADEIHQAEQILVVSYVYRKIGGGGEILWRSVRQREIPDPLGEIFYARKVVIALHVFVRRLIVGIGKPFQFQIFLLIIGIALLESHSSFNFSCLFVAKPSKVDLN